MFGEWDITFCMNVGCGLSNTCGRSIKRLAGKRAIVSMSAFKPDPDNHCDHELPFTEYHVPTWMSEAAEKAEERYNNELARRKELLDSGGLDSDVGL